MSRMFEKSLFPLLVLMAGTLFSCQRKAEEPVVSPGAGRGQVWFEVSERPMGGETKAAPATIATFTSLYESFGVVGYAYASDTPSTKTKDASGTMEVSYVIDRERWEPATPVGYSFAGNSLEFYAWYPYNNTTVPVTAPATINDTAHPTIAYAVPSDVADQKDLMVAVKTGVTDSPSTDTPVQLTFGHMLTAVKFSIGENTTCSSITLSGISGTGTLDMSTGAWSSLGTADATYIIDHPTFGSADANGQCLIDEDLTLMLIPQTLPADAKLTAETSTGTITSSITASLAGQEWKPGKEVTYKITDPVPSFTVSSTGDKVRFSPGNLQAVFAAPGTSFTWKFAANQWDYIGGRKQGGSEAQTGNNFINGNGSVSDAGTVDLFGWSTSDTTYGINPSKSGTDYSGDFVDWGNDPSLVSALGSGWRTLTRAEWVWLLGPASSPNPGTNCRRSSTVSGTENARFAKAYLFGSVHGLIIFPDVYTHPDGVEEPTGINATDDTSWDSNQYTEAKWAKMESAGCVFLPAAGLRNGTSVSSTGTYGFYKSSAKSGTDRVFLLNFFSNAVNPTYDSPLVFGHSVRLVQDL